MFLPLSRTPPFSSDEEESEEEDSDTEEEQPLKHQRGIQQQPRPNQAAPIQIRASKASPILERQAAVRQSSASSLQHSHVKTAGPTKTAVTQIESDEEEDDWSDVSELEEIDPKRLQSYKDQNGNMDTRKGL